MSSIDIDNALAHSGQDIISALLDAPEDQWFDRKSGRAKASDLARPLIAFANAEGGTIAVGLHNGVFEGVSPENVNAIR